MNARIRNKIFQQWNKDSQAAYKRQGIGRVIKALNGFCIYLNPGNGYEYHQCINGRIVKIRR